MGGGRAREMCGDEPSFAHGSAAAALSRASPLGCTVRRHLVRQRPAVRLLPLPTETACRCTSTASSRVLQPTRHLVRRRSDSARGQLRSEWNMALLEDVGRSDLRSAAAGGARPAQGSAEGTLRAVAEARATVGARRRRLAAAVHRQLLGSRGYLARRRTWVTPTPPCSAASGRRRTTRRRARCCCARRMPRWRRRRACATGARGGGGGGRDAAGGGCAGGAVVAWAARRTSEELTLEEGGELAAAVRRRFAGGRLRLAARAAAAARVGRDGHDWRGVGVAAARVAARHLARCCVRTSDC